MSVAASPKGRASLRDGSPSTPGSSAPTDPAGPLPDLLAGLRWGTREVLVVAAVLLLADVFAGWSYLASYFGYFRVPAEGLGLSLPEVLGQGLRSLLLPLTVVVVAAAAPSRRLRPAAIAVGVYLLFIALVALGNHWVSPGAVLVQLAVSIAVAGIVFGLRLGFGRRPGERLMIGAAAVLLLISLPIASGILDAAQLAGSKTTTLRLVTSSPILPDAVPASGQFTYTNYVLLRETDSRYWLFRIGDRYAYSIAKSAVAYIRY